MVDSVKVVRTLAQQEKLTGFTRPSLYGGDGKNVVFGSESNANFIDVLSVGPITSIEDIQINDSTITTEEFPLSQFYLHTGDEAAAPFEGDFPYVERTISLSKQAEVIEGSKYNIHTTDFKKAVSSLGVLGVRINFNTGQFVHRDKENRRKTAFANFRLHILDEDGNRKKSTGYSQPQYFYASNPTSVNLSILADEEDKNRLWEYEVEMRIMTNNYGTTVSGTWSASTVTELYKDTQTYENIAMVSGKIVASDVGGSVPNRQYLVNGYKVDVPVYIGENNLFLGEFKKETSNSHAWNAMAVLIDDKWGGDLPLDKINIASFVEFDKYLSETLSDGSQRYSHSQELVKADNYFRIASQIVGAADGKLYEDTSGRIGVLVDKQTDSRRIITSYDIQDEKVKRTTVPEKKKTNYVQIEFDDETNNYLTTIISTQDDIAITKNGLIQNNLKSDTCTNPLEAKRVIDKVLATSQYTPSSYVFSVGHTHEDVQIGEVVALYDRLYSRVNYCGKTAEGSTLTRVEIDPRTPVNLEGISNPYLVLDSNRGVPIKTQILSWTDRYIELSNPLDVAPETFTSFGVESGDVVGLKPTLVRILGITDNQGTLQLEGIDYNDSLYSHVENGTEIITPVTRILPELQEEIQSLTLTKITAGISANWDDAEEGTYVYFWKKFTGDTERDPNNTGILVTSGQTSVSNNTLPLPLEPARYEFSVYILDELTGESSSTKSVSIDLDITDSATSSIPQPTNFDTEEGQGSYTGRGFTLKWDQVVGTETPYLMGYILRITQGGSTLEYRLTSDYRSYQITPQALTEAFGGDYSRNFTARLIAYDDTLASAPTVTRVVNNTAPISPEITVRVTGDILLSSDSGVPEDAIGSLVYVWESSDVNSARPTTALVFSSNQVAEIDLPNDTLVYDNRDYVFEAAWIDGFGETEANYGRAQIAFGPDVLVPEPMSLIRANAYSITGIQVEFEHDGVWLEKMKVYYRKTNESGEFLLDDSYLFEGDARVSYDEGSQSGTFIIEGLDYNSEYEVYTTVSNVSSADSEVSGIVIGITIPYANVEDIRDDLTNITNDIVDLNEQTDELRDAEVGLREDVSDLQQTTDDLASSIEDTIVDVSELGDSLKRDLQLETSKREDSDKAMFQTAASLAEFRRTNQSEINTLRDATFEVDPETGTIGLRAYNYADNQFTQAGILIDGVDAKVNINAGKIVDLGTSVQDANASIDVLAGQVEIKASYTEMTEYVNGALDAIIPAYSFGFFNSSEGWSAVNGTITQGNSFIRATWGDIENQMLNYSADDNPIITLTTKRSSGSGFTGDLVVTFDGGATETYTAALSQGTVGVTNVQNLNLTEDATYTGTVTGLRIVLGESVADEFEISSITIGKPSAQLEALDGVTAQVNQLGIDVDAIEGQLTSFVTTTFYDENTVTLNNVTQVLDGEESIISLKATQQELDSEGTITKANNASVWIDGADATIRSTVISFNAEDGGIDDQIQGLVGGLDSVTQELSTIDGAKIQTNLLSISNLETKNKDVEELQFYAELKLLEQKNDALDLGDSVATIDNTVKATTTELGALSLDFQSLSASTGLLEGQVNANADSLTQVQTNVNGNSSAISQLELEAENTATELSSLVTRVDEVEIDIETGATALSQVVGQVNDPVNNTSALFQSVQQANVDIAGNTSSITALTTRVEDTEAGVSANTSDIQSSSIDIDNNATAISDLSVRVTGAEGDITATAGLAQQAQLTADGNTTSINNLSTRVTDAESEIDVSTGLIQQAQIDIDENAAATSAIETRVTNAESGISSNAQLIQDVDVKADGNATSITTLQNRVEDAESDISGNSGLIQAVDLRVDGTVDSIASLGTRVTNSENDISNAEILLGSTIDELGNVSSRAYLGVSETVDGKTTVTGITADSSTNGLRFQGDVVQFDDSAGNPALQYRADLNKWVFTGNVVVGGYTVESEDDIRALDGDTIYETYQYSVDGSTNWHDDYSTGDIFRRTATVTNGVLGAWRDVSRITGLEGPQGESAVNFYTSAGEFTKSGSDYIKQNAQGWNAGFSTREKYIYATASARVSSSSQIMVGLSTAPSQGDFSLLEYALYSENGQLSVVENGSRKGDYGNVSGASVLSVTWDGVSVKYYKDAVLLYTSTTTPSGSVLFDLCAFDTGAVFAEPMFFPAAKGGEKGEVGAGFYGSTYSSISWTTSTANSRFSALVGRDPVEFDILTQTRTDGTDSQARQYNGSSWESVALQVNGSIVARGTVAGDRLIAGTEISAPRIVGGEIVTDTGSGVRGEYYDDGTYLQWIGTGTKTDTNALFYVKRNGTGFIKGDFFQGEIIATVSATNSGNSSAVSATSGSYISAGKPVSVNFNQTLTVTVKGDTHTPQDFSCRVIIKRGSSTLKTVTIQPSRYNYPPSAGGGVGELDTEAVYDLSSFVIDDSSAVESRSYTIESTSLTSPSSPYTYYTDHEVSLYAQENKLA